MQSHTLTEINRALAHKSFWEYRQIIRPKMKLSWWQRDCAGHLQQFAEDMWSGRKPVLVIQAPPQHGKSEQVSDFIGWLSGKDPDLPTIFTTFSDRLSVRTNTGLQRLYSNPEYQRLFPELQISSDNVVTKAGRPLRNSEIIEYAGRDGYFRNTTVLGSITGEGLGLGIVDDPLKGRKSANSPTIRQAVWDWFTDDFYSRFTEDAGLLIVMTRWHIDDLIGRMKSPADDADQLFPDMKIVTYKAIATEDEEFRKAGEPLFPEHKSLDFLLKRKRVMTAARWSALYQQEPMQEGGKLLHPELIVIIDNAPEIIRRVRYWDTAGTQGGGCYTVGALVGITRTKQPVLLDIVRGQWSRAIREAKIRQTAELDGHSVKVYVERQGGSSGKENVQDTIRNLSGFSAYEDLPTGDKILRSEPVGAAMENSDFLMVRADWNKAFIEECELFPDGYKDQVDAVSGAWSKLNKRGVNIW